MRTIKSDDIELKRFVWLAYLENTIHCPNCGCDLDHFYRGDFEQFQPNFCPDCGQELDWMENRLYGVHEEH